MYIDVTVSFSKSISVLHACLRENERRARLAADQQAAAYWAGREQVFQEILYRANRAALEYLQAWAGVTRTGALVLPTTQRSMHYEGVLMGLAARLCPPHWRRG